MVVHAYALSPTRLALRALVGLSGEGAEGRTSWIDVAYTGTWKGHPAGEFSLDTDKFAECVSQFDAQENPISVDYEHASLDAPPTGAPAAGWVQALEIRGDHLWAQVEWTERAAAMIRAGEYRYCSPVFTFAEPDRKTGLASVCAIDSVALTNRPFIDGQKPIALSRTENTMPDEAPAAQTTDAGAMIAARLMEAGGFADAAALLAALDQNLEAVVGALKGSTAQAGEAAAAAAAAPAPDAALVAEVAALRKQVTSMSTELTGYRDDASKRADTALVAEVDAAVSAGKIHPASRDEFIALARKAPENFRALAAKLPATSPAVAATLPTVGPGQSMTLDLEKRRVELAQNLKSKWLLTDEQVKQTVERTLAQEGT